MSATDVASDRGDATIHHQWKRDVRAVADRTPVTATCGATTRAAHVREWIPAVTCRRCREVIGAD